MNKAIEKPYYIGVKRLIVKNHKVLHLKRRLNDEILWDLRGGRMQEKENIEDALNREVSEELIGIRDIRVRKLINAKRIRQFNRKSIGLLLLFFLIHANVEIVTTSDEHEEIKWIDEVEAQRLSRKANTRIEIEPVPIALNEL